MQKNIIISSLAEVNTAAKKVLAFLGTQKKIHQWDTPIQIVFYFHLVKKVN